jgi:hypothetical protein
MKTHQEILADADTIATLISKTDQAQVDELYDAVANMLRVKQDIFTSMLFEALARSERQETKAPMTQRLARAVRA